jgi:hypothetical protein
MLFILYESVFIFLCHSVLDTESRFCLPSSTLLDSRLRGNDKMRAGMTRRRADYALKKFRGLKQWGETPIRPGNSPTLEKIAEIGENSPDGRAEAPHQTKTDADPNGSLTGYPL